MKKLHSKERKKFQKKFVEMLIDTKSIGYIIDSYKILTMKQLYKMTDKELVDYALEIDMEPDLYSMGQWVDFCEFEKYVRKSK
tara:strand:+ start:68 stop:316 length:249 start_codon:yes stop_codon:yes gene_type:complete